MTRKRFVKLVMSFNVGRNESNEIARLVHEDGLSYSEAYGYILPRLFRLKASLVIARALLNAWTNGF